MHIDNQSIIKKLQNYKKKFSKYLERIRKVSTFASAFENESTTAKALSSFKNEMQKVL